MICEICKRNENGSSVSYCYGKGEAETMPREAAKITTRFSFNPIRFGEIQVCDKCVKDKTYRIIKGHLIITSLCLVGIITIGCSSYLIGKRAGIIGQLFVFIIPVLILQRQIF